MDAARSESLGRPWHWNWRRELGIDDGVFLLKEQLSVSDQ
jgi:hypothetical protein